MNYLILTLVCFSVQLHARFDTYRGIQAYKKGDFKKAQEELQKSLINNPHDPDLLYNNADVAFRLNDFDKAALYFKKAATQSTYANPVHEKALFNLGTTYAKQEKLEEALTTFNQLLRENPAHERALRNKKIVEELLKKKEEQQKKDKSCQNKKGNDKKGQDQNKDENQKDSSTEKQQETQQDQQQKQDGNGSEKDGDQNDQQKSQGSEQDDQGQQWQQKNDGSLDKSKKSGKDSQQERRTGNEKGDSQDDLKGNQERGVDKKGTDAKGSKDQQTLHNKNLSAANEDKKGTPGAKKAQQNKEPLFATDDQQQETQEDKEQPEYQLLKAIDKAEEDVGKDLFKTMVRAKMKGGQTDGQKNW